MYVAENDVDGDAFVMLNDEVIKELIPAVGTRLKFHSAYARLLQLSHSECSGTFTPNDYPQAQVPAAKTRGKKIATNSQCYIHKRTPQDFWRPRKKLGKPMYSKKSGSRSKSKDMTGIEPVIKRAKISKDEIKSKIIETGHELELMKKQITTKQQIIAKATTLREYQQSDKAQTEARELN